LGWSPDENFNTGILKTVKWYLNNKIWWEKLQDGRNEGMVE
jgi:dTDP-glucose 4,6-dehydratase